MRDLFDWCWFGFLRYIKNWFGDYAMILVRNEYGIRFRLAKKGYQVHKGREWKLQGQTIYEAEGYPVELMDGYRLMGHTKGEAFVVPFAGSGIIVDSLYAEMVEADLLTKALQYIKAEGTGFKLSWKWILLGVILLAVGVGVWYFFLGGNVQEIVLPPGQPLPSPTPPRIGG